MGSRWPLWIHIIVDHHNYWQEAAEACLHDIYYWRPFAFVNDVAAPPTSPATMEWNGKGQSCQEQPILLQEG